MPAAICLTDLEKTYRTGAVDVPVLRGLTAEIAVGERVALLGRSGSGKSTLLNLLGGLDRATGGSIEIEGHRLDEFSAKQMADYRLSTVGMIFQGYNLLSAKTAIENVALPLLFSGSNRSERIAAATASMAAVGLAERLDHTPTELSGGEQQRVAIARALVNRPRILLADEPTGNLDSSTATEVVEVIDKLVRENEITVVLVTHDERLAADFSDRVLHIQDGMILEADRVEPGSV